MKMRIASIVAITLLLLAVLTVYIINSKDLAQDNRVSFVLELSIYTPAGELEGYAKVFIYELRRDGETRLIEKQMAQGGVMSTTLSVEKIPCWLPQNTPPWWPEGSDPIYQTVNLRILVFGGHGTISWGLPVDPLEVEREGKLVLKLTERPYMSGEVYDEAAIMAIDDFTLEVEEISREWTPIVTYHSWDNVTAYLNVNYGTKYSEVKKERQSLEWPPGSGQWYTGDWTEAGNTVVTIEHGFDSSPTITGQKRMETLFYLTYKYERWDGRVDGHHYKIEYVYLLDTDSDPTGNDFTSGSPLSGNGVSDPWNYGHYDFIDQGVTGWKFPIYGHGGEKLRFSVSVGFSAQWPPGVSVSVTLTVWKEYQDPTPMFIKYNVGRWYPGYYFYVYDRNTGDMQLYATWATAPP